MKLLPILCCTLLLIPGALAQNENHELKMEEKTFESTSGKMVEGEAGALEVPENRNVDQTENITIHFVRLKSNNPNPQAPVVYLEGGPGSSCTWMAGDPHALEGWLPFLELGDVILLDQRGTGAGSRRVSYRWKKDIPENILTDPEVVRRHFQTMAKEAMADFESRGVDLSGYTTLESAGDIDALRQALGYENVSLFGFSYGTHLGQAYIKYFGDYVENAVLIGVEGLHHTFKLPSAMDVQLKKIALLAKQDPNVNETVPDLLELYRSVVRRLKREPVEVEVKSPLTGEPVMVKVGAYGLNFILRFDIGDASDLPVFPRLLYSIDRGDYSLLQWFVQKRIRLFYGIQGMSATMDAASGVSPSRLARIREDKRKSLFKDVVNPRLDLGWPSPDLGEDFRAPLVTDTRTLFFSGTLDFNTPPYQAEEVRWGFSNSSHIIINYAGHEQILTHPETVPTIIRFLKGENVDDVALFYPKLTFIPVEGDAGERRHPAMGRN